MTESLIERVQQSVAFAILTALMGLYLCQRFSAFGDGQDIEPWISGQLLSLIFLPKTVEVCLELAVETDVIAGEETEV